MSNDVKFFETLCILRLMRSYLSNRRQYTKMFDTKSSSRNIDCVVPKGSCLGSPLFLMYINDLPRASKFRTNLFADDACLCLSDPDMCSLQNRVNTEPKNVDAWLRSNKLSVNYSKTNFMLIKKHPHKKVEYDFRLSMNSVVLKRF